MDAARLYNELLHFDQHVRCKVVGAPAVRLGTGGNAVRLPREYREWANSASEDEVDTLWDKVLSGDVLGAREVSGLSLQTIGLLIALASSSSGGSQRLDCRYRGIPVHIMRLLIQEANARKVVKRYANRRSGPPFEALTPAMRKALARLANAMREWYDDVAAG